LKNEKSNNDLIGKKTPPISEKDELAECPYHKT